MAQRSTRRRQNKSNDKKSTNRLSNNELNILDKAARSLYSMLNSGYEDEEELSEKDKRIRDVLDRELEISKGVSNGSIVDFVSSITKSDSKMKLSSQSLRPDTNNLFTQNINDIFGYFQDMYKNRFLEMSDLKFISKFIPALGEAVRTTLDSVVGSDSLSETINRQIRLPDGIDSDLKTIIMNEIKRNEKELKLLQKLRNIVYKKTLVTGTFYVYAVSYNKIFEEFDKIKKSEQSRGNTRRKGMIIGNQTKAATENVNMIGDIDYTSALENVQSLIQSSKPEGKMKFSTSEITGMMNEFKSELPIITCDHSSLPYDVQTSVSAIFESSIAMEAFTKSRTPKPGDHFNTKAPNNVLSSMVPDGTKGIDDVKAGNFNVVGTYIKYIDAKNIIPIKIFDQTVGYYLIHPKAKNNKKSAGMTTGITSIGSTLFNAVSVAEHKKQDAIDKIINTISEGIIDNFNDKFVTKNADFKKVIADCIIANGLTDKDYNIQFIPADDIIEFKINENDDGFGESILMDSLFPAKLALSTMVCRLLNYINKTGNKTIAHIHKGPINPYTSNQVDRVIRDLQNQNVTFNDLLSPNLVFNKFNRDGNISLPTANNGNHLIDFETQEGQNIEMSPEYEKYLVDQAIIGTGVPSVIMEYCGQNIEFAKEIVSAHIKYAGRITRLQVDLEEPTTELYKKIVANSNMSDECKNICYQSLEFYLPRPRAASNTNTSDFVRTVIDTAEVVADAKIGRDSVQNQEVLKNGQRIKERLLYEYVRKYAPFIDWDEIDEMYDDICAELQNEPIPKPEENSGNGGY